MHLALFLKGNGIAIRGDAPDTTCGAAYSFTYTVSGGQGPYIFTVSDGVLPQGLSLNPVTGAITGTVLCPVQTVLTSPLYPLEVVEAIDSAGVATAGYTLANPIEAVDSFGSINGGSLRSILVTYNGWPAEAVDSFGVLSGGTLVEQNPPLLYDLYSESVDSFGVIGNGELKAILISYENWPSEAVDSAGSITGGSLT